MPSVETIAAEFRQIIPALPVLEVSENFSFGAFRAMCRVLNDYVILTCEPVRQECLVKRLKLTGEATWPRNADPWET